MRGITLWIAVLWLVSEAGLARADDRFTVSPDYPRRSWHPAAPDGTGGGAPAPRPAPPSWGPGVPTPAPVGLPAPGAFPRECYDVCAPCPSRTLEVGARGRWWRACASGDLYITLGGEPGTANNLDLRDDLDLDGANAWTAEVDVRLGRHRARFAYEDLSFSGTATFERARIYHGFTYPAGERVESEVSLRSFDASYEFQAVGGDRTILGAGVGGRLWTLDTRLRGTTSGLDEERGFTHVLPFGGATAYHRLGTFALTAGARVGFLSDTRWMLDLEAGLAWRPCASVVLSLGWRRLEFSFDETTNTGDLVFSGPYLGLSASF
jgi:hypothetical protein